MPLCHDVTIKSVEILRSFNGSSKKGCVTQKMCHLAGFYINLSTIHFCEMFVKYSNSTKKMTPGKKVVESY